MITIYTYDDRGVFSGSVEVDEMGVVPSGMLSEPPETTGTEVAAIRNGEWVVLPEYPAAKPPTVPHQVTRRQARQALHLAGHLENVPLVIAAIPNATQRKLAQIEWEDSLNFERNRPLLISLATALGMNSAGLDAIFIQASQL